MLLLKILKNVFAIINFPIGVFCMHIILMATVIMAGDEEETIIYADTPSPEERSYFRIFKSMETDRGVRPWRLPNTTYPLKYHLHITTNIHREIYEYNGNCTIEIFVRKNTQELVLHAFNLEIIEISVEDVTTNTKFNNLIHIQITDLLVISTSENVIGSKTAIFPQNHELRVIILYKSVITSGKMGFHKVTYNETNNRTVVGAATQCEPLYARTVLPCYDEPSFKSNFTVRITHGRNYTAISNMPQCGESIESEDGNMLTTTFMETPPMSTYLLAFFISNYVNISTQTNDEGVFQRVFTPPLSELDARATLDIAQIALKTFSEFMEIPFVLPKLDHVALSITYGDAMENWGLITYLDSVFLKTNEFDMYQSFGLSSTLNHELVHQWFGNLVTPIWWNHVWLNEGFATYYSYVLTDMIYPHYKCMKSFNKNICSGSLSYDPIEASVNERPTSDYVEKPLDIISLFNGLIYNRAPCIIQMFDHALTQPVFRKGVSNFLKKFAYNVVSEDNLYDELQSAAIEHHLRRNEIWNYTIKEMMGSWIHSVDYPVVTITRNYSRSNAIIIHQKSATHNSTQLWWIPINFATTTQANFTNTIVDFYMPPVPEVHLDLSDLNIELKRDDWLIANKLGRGLYHVKYDSENLRIIGAALLQNPNAIHEDNREHMLKSLMNFSFTTESVDLQPVLELLKYLRGENDPYVWFSISAALVDLNKLLRGTNSLELFNNYLRNIITPYYQRYKHQLPLTKNSTPSEMSVEDLMYLACIVDLPDCLMERKALILKQISGQLEDYDKYDISISLCSAAKVLSDDEFDKALNFYMHKYEDEQLWHLLRCTKSDQQYQRLLQVAFDVDGNESNCTKKLYFLAELLHCDYVTMRNLTWLMMDKHIEKVLNTSQCNVDVFCDSLLQMSVFIQDKYKKKYIEILQLCEEQHLKSSPSNTDKSYIIKEENIGKQDLKRRLFQNNINDDELYKWLEKENEIANRSNR